MSNSQLTNIHNCPIYLCGKLLLKDRTRRRNNNVYLCLGRHQLIIKEIK